MRIRLHFVSAHLVVVEVLEPAAKIFRAEASGRGRGLAGVFENLLRDEDGAVRTKSKSDGVGGAGVEGDDFPALIHPDGGVKGVFAEVADDDAGDAGVEAVDDVAEEVVGHRADRGGLLDFERDGVGFEETDPDGENDFAGEIVEDDDGLAGGGVHHEAPDAHLDFLLGGELLRGLGFEAGQVHGA